IELMFRASAVRIVGSWTHLIFVDIHLQIRVSAEEPPLREDPPLGVRLYAISSPAHIVGGHKGNDQIRRDWAPFHEGCARFRYAEIGVIVIERGNIRGEGAGGLNAVSEFICDE